MRRLHIHRSVALLCFLLALSCQTPHGVEGKYEATPPGPNDTSMILVLKTDGKGFWTVDDEDVDFTWEVRGNDIWLHSRTGGVVTGKITSKDAIRIDLPGVGNFAFERVRE